jgi:hypothetical protein
MRSSEGDEIFQMLCEGTPELVPERNRGVFHDELSRLVVVARKCGLDKTADVFHFSVIALSTRYDFYLHPEVSEAWTKIANQDISFELLVGTWTDRTWEMLAEPVDQANSESSTNGASR